MNASFSFVHPTKPERGNLYVSRPTQLEMVKTAATALEIFVEAFTTTYTAYHEKSGSKDPIETWLKLREKLTLKSWLESTFTHEFEEYWRGEKGFLFLSDETRRLVGWLSHSPISAKGEVYLSQCSLEGESRHQKIATELFNKVFREGQIATIFPGIREVRLITRKINTIAETLYTNVGFVKDENLDPSVYGAAYDDRYVGYKKVLS